MAEPAIDSFGSPSARPVSSKFNKAWLTMLGSGALAFVLFFAATTANRGTIPVLVAKRPIAQGEAFSIDDFTRTNIHIQGDSSVSLVNVSKQETIDGLSKENATQPIAKGSFLVDGEFGAKNDNTSQRWFSVQVDSANAVAGDLTINQEIDIFDACGQEVGFRLKVISVSKGSSGGIGNSSGSGKLTLKLATDDQQINSVVKQALSGKYEIVANNGRPDLRPDQLLPCGGSN